MEAGSCSYWGVRRESFWKRFPIFSDFITWGKYQMTLTVLFSCIPLMKPQEVEVGSPVKMPGRNTQRKIFNGKLRKEAGMNQAW
jgi:hypothetical protein